jgi:dTDP-glucose 4,6-dehydratase
MKVVVIGSNSFSGSHFIDMLLSSTEYEVIGISRSDEKKDFYLPYKKRDLSKFKFHKLDLNRDMSKILNLFDDLKPEYIVNFASQSMVGESWDNPEHWYNTNVLSIITLTNSLKGKEYLKKYVHISTPEVYGSCSGTVKEDALFNPSTPYAASRAAADEFILMLVKNFEFPAVFTRAANVYGPGQQLFKIIPRSIIFIKNNEKIPLHGGGLAERSFIHIQDVCEATLKIMEQSKSGEIYNLSTNTLHSIKDIVKLICGRMDVDFEKSVEDVETRRGLDKAYILDSSKAENEFGWKPKISLEEGIDETIKWINDSFVEISKEPLGYVHKE